MDKDIEYLNKIINVKSRKNLYYHYFCWLYPFTNENLKGYYQHINFKNKDVITVTSSGDHALNAILLGAKNIDTFDINPLAKYYSELKIASIKSLSLEEFILFLYNKNIFRMPKYYMSKELYNRVREKLDGKYLSFWDYVFNIYNKKEIYRSHLFTDDYLNIKDLLKANMYLSEENYYKLREQLCNISINYIDCNLKDLDKFDKKYDVIILSNIPAFLDLIYDSNVDVLKELYLIINNLKKYNSKVVVSYLYSSISDTSSHKDIYNSIEVRKYFNSSEYDYEFFTSASDLSKPSYIKSLSNYYDSVIISK